MSQLNKIYQTKSQQRGRKGFGNYKTDIQINNYINIFFNNPQNLVNINNLGNPTISINNSIANKLVLPNVKTRRTKA